MKLPQIPALLLPFALAATVPRSPGATFGEDVSFLRAHTPVIVLGAGDARIAVSPAWQGRVLTSTAAGETGRSFGWINRELIASGKTIPHMNAFGGEDRLWLGPEGGQYSIYFAKGAPFDFDHWFVPAAFDTRPFQTVAQAEDRASFQSKFSLVNYSGTQFDVLIRREVRLFGTGAAWAQLRMTPVQRVRMVGYESANRLTNAGPKPWKKDSGLLSLWVLGMFTPSSGATIAVPIKAGPESELGVRVTSDYFGPVPDARLRVTDKAVFLRADGKFRSKIGINPRRSLAKLGGYDADHRVLTIVQFDQPAGVTEYVNSLWKLQDNPYGGDAENSYNDGPPAPGAKPLGPFFEMESSSPAAALRPGETIEHTHRTFHLTGDERQLDLVARSVLGIPLDAIKRAF